MDIWLSAAELAKLSGWPSTERRARDRAKREGLPSRPRQGRGGGQEFLISINNSGQQIENQPYEQIISDREEALPDEAAIYKEYQAVTYPDIFPQAGEIATEIEVSFDPPLARPRRNELTPYQEQRRSKKGDRAAAQLEILQAFTQWCEANGYSKGENLLQGEYAFCEQYNQGAIAVSEAARGLIKTMCRATLKNWQKAIATQGLNALGGGYGKRKGTHKMGTLPDDVRGSILAYWVRNPNLSYQNLYNFALIEFEKIPSYRTFCRWLNGWKEENPQFVAFAENPDGYKSKFAPAFGSMAALHFNSRWELDATPKDVLIKVGDKELRFRATGIIECYSRQAIVLITRTVNAEATAAVLRLAFLRWGIPDAIWTDNGKEFSNRQIENICTALGINFKRCIPGKPEGKPFIERFLGHFNNNLSQMLPGYLGRNVGERRAIEARKRKYKWAEEEPLSLSELQEVTERWLTQYNAVRKHDGLGMTPAAKGEVGKRERSPRKIAAGDERKLNLLLASCPDRGGIRAVGKKGIQIKPSELDLPEGECFYISPELALEIGNKLYCKFDPFDHDMGRIYTFRDANCQEFVCTAENPYLTGIDRRLIAAKAKALAEANIKLMKQELREMRLKSSREFIDAILGASDEAAGKISTLRSPVIDFALPEGLQEALLPSAIPAPPSAEELEREMAALAAVERQPSSIQIKDSDYWYSLWEALNMGQTIDPTDVEWMEWWLIETPPGEGIQLALEPLQRQEILNRLRVNNRQAATG